MKKDNYIEDNIIASFLDGNTDKEETMMVLDAASKDTELSDYLEFARELDGNPFNEDTLPMMCCAANDDDGNECSVKCELYIMRRLGIAVTLGELLEASRSKEWLSDDGTALLNVGRLLEEKGLSVHRKFDASLDDIVSSLENGLEVLVMVDGGELVGDDEQEALEDEILGEIPDHTVVVLLADAKGDEIVLYDPAGGEMPISVTVDKFLDAWQDSHNYMLTVTTREKRASHYTPSPIDLSDVDVDDDLVKLREAIAENAHEVWAQGRMAEGWRYGPTRNDKLKLHPDLLPYSDLPDSEKEYDRETAMKTIMLLKKLGYEIRNRRFDIIVADHNPE